MEHDYAYRQMMKKKAKEDDSVEKFTEPTVEDALLRLVQICRAVGVHIIACTQRTSVDIISGTIKTNFPTRISLRLPTGTDSRTILGTIGAENLLGKGDMLIKKPDTDNVERFHGPFVRLEDVKAVLQDRDMILKMLGAA
jgi:S-DNA-T family DNA segregation ATPase FtsK/SpoIIIE